MSSANWDETLDNQMGSEPSFGRLPDGSWAIHGATGVGSATKIIAHDFTSIDHQALCNDLSDIDHLGQPDNGYAVDGFTNQCPLSPNVDIGTCENQSQDCFNPTDQLSTPVGLLWSDGSVTTPSHASGACGVTQPVLPVNGVSIEDPWSMNGNGISFEALTNPNVTDGFGPLSTNINDNYFEAFSINTPTVTNKSSVPAWEPGLQNSFHDGNSGIDMSNYFGQGNYINSVPRVEALITPSDLAAPVASVGIYAMNQPHHGAHLLAASSASSPQQTATLTFSTRSPRTHFQLTSKPPAYTPSATLHSPAPQTSPATSTPLTVMAKTAPSISVLCLVVARVRARGIRAKISWWSICGGSMVS